MVVLMLHELLISIKMGKKGMAHQTHNQLFKVKILQNSWLWLIQINQLLFNLSLYSEIDLDYSVNQN